MATHIKFDFNQKIGSKKLEQFAVIVNNMSRQIGFKVSSRGWCYLMEQAGYIDKSQFDKVESAINRCRKDGLLPVDFVAEEDARAFVGVETPNVFTDKPTVKHTLRWMMERVLEGHYYYTPDWWEGEQYYIQMLVEKIDLKTLFESVCRDYHIPIANAKGWSSILQRAEYARRFKEAERRGLTCVLLYCGDHDPDGLRISDTIRKNLSDLKDVFWSDDQEGGYDPKNLIIERFGLNYDFIIDNGYTWIDNLITGGGLDLSSPLHKNHKLPYVQQYIGKVGVRKCEANAIVTTPNKAYRLVTEEIERWLGPDAQERFASKRFAIQAEYQELLDETMLREPIETILNDKIE